MKYYFLRTLLIFLLPILAFGQNKIDLKAKFDIENRQISITQTITYTNTTRDTLKTIYLNDWNNSYATKKTALATRIADEYIKDFHLAKNEERGFSVITSIKQNNESLNFEQLKNQIDVIKVSLKTPLSPQASYTIDLQYLVKIPSDKFTSYGITPDGDLNLKYWYITPAIYDGEWQYFSNKNLDDLYIPKSDLDIEIEFPKAYYLTSELNIDNILETSTKNRIVKLSGKNRINTKLYLNKSLTFSTIESNGISVVSSIDDEGLEFIDKALLTEKVIDFITKNLGEYPHERLVVSEIDFTKDPIYGLNFLPKFIKPYPNHFQYELRLLKIALHNYLDNTLLINPRKDQWLFDAIQIFYLIKYVDDRYPNMKFLGSISGFWGVRSFHAADMKFNEKYTFGHMVMARTNKDQPLTMAKDSLLKFNKNIASKYKAGIGLKYLDDFINSNIVEESLTTFLTETKLQTTTTKAFETFLKSRTSKDIDWFFTDYLKTRKKIDFKIKNVKKSKDSITLTIKNKRHNSMPVSLYALNNDSIISKTWVEHINDSKTITIPRQEANKLVLNYERTIPEINLRDNWKSLKGFFFNNKPLQFRLIKDVEDPHYNQVFLMPLAEFNNIYDGITLGMRFYNTALLRKRFNYKIAPKYSFTSKSFTGAAAISMEHNFENNNLYLLNYGIRAGYTSYAEDLFVRQVIPSVKLLFRQDNDFRSNKRQALIFRYVDINRDKDPTNVLSTSEPNYSIFNTRYIHSNDNLIHFNKWYVDFQVAKKFTKIAFNYEYRRLFESNRQLNLRLYGGTFLENNTDTNSKYFSFALDRPTDYLFDYAYLGRSEETGIFSQQYIDAEGGFKSKLQTPYANQWITTLNASTTLWNYILLYGDIGLVKNKGFNPKFVYDSGIRVNLVTDYFEVYFPIYSNLGWEIGQPNYDQKIRFKFTVDPQVLLGLFRRRWF
ncbi:gluzincin family metallopeptidase [Aestuariivivens insulae]|uniref:metalloprotease n=1 Tax=Aestuariivivens insulae TaxID=1621988 RepID=UPI001F564975|nr:metalloprotease [Aestuariivivens insulae]